MKINEKQIASKIKAIRLQRGETMKDFGKNFNPPASDSIVSRWERAVSLPNSERLKRIAELGNITVDELLSDKSDSKYNKKNLEKAVIESTVTPFNQTAFDYVFKAINEVDFLSFGLLEITVMYAHNLSEKNKPIKDMESLLNYLKSSYENISGFLEETPDLNHDMAMDLSIELQSLQHQINEIEKHLNN